MRDVCTVLLSTSSSCHIWYC